MDFNTTIAKYVLNDGGNLAEVRICCSLLRAFLGFIRVHTSSYFWLIHIFLLKGVLFGWGKLHLLTYLLTYLQTYLLAYLLKNLLTPWIRVLLEKLTGLRLVKKVPAFYGTRMSITAFTSARHLSLSWARSIRPMPPHPTSWRYILVLSSHLCLGHPSGLFP